MANQVRTCQVREQFGNGPRATPAVAEGRVYTYGITGVLTCFEAASGKIVWQVDARKEFTALYPTFGFSWSPLVAGKNVIVDVGAKGASVVAFDKDKGKVAWKSLDDRASYSSPMIFGDGNERQVSFLDGREPGRSETRRRQPRLAVPVQGSALRKLGDAGQAGRQSPRQLHHRRQRRLVTREGKDVKEVWKNPTLNSYFSTPVAVGKEHVFMVTGDLFKRQASLRCVKVSDGKEVWTKDKVGTFPAALLKTGDDKILMLTDGGQLVLLAADTKAYQELARAKVCGQAWAPPALSNGKLFVRDDRELICLEVGK